MGKKVLIHNLSEPLHETRMARFDVNTGTGNLMINRLASGEELLARGTLEYMENQDPPAWTVDGRDGLAALTLKARGGRQPGFRLPWATCNGATNWQIYINPLVSSDITAHSGGGNVKLDLSGLIISQVSVDSGGGNLDMTLPDSAANLTVLAKTGGGNVTIELGNGTTGKNTVTATSGAGNVVVHLSARVAALIHATTGMGKVVIDSRFNRIDKSTYQSPDYDSAMNRIEITAKSGAGNVSVITR